MVHRTTMGAAHALRTTPLLALLLAALALPAGAEPTPEEAPTASEAATTTLETVTVTASPSGKDSYAASTASVASKMALTPRETPQSISVLTRQRREDQNLTDATSALMWVPGMANGWANESETASFTARGFLADNIAMDGHLSGNAFWQLPADLSMYEQIEVLRGPAGLFHGRGTSGSPGGTINFQRKRPLARPLLRLELAAGQWDHYRSTVDVSRPLSHDGRVRGRLVASALRQKDFIDYAGRHNQMLYGVLEQDLLPGTKLTLGLDHDRRRAVPTYRLATFRGDGSDPRWPRSQAWMTPWARWDGDTTGAFAELEHRLGADWLLKASYHYRREKLYWDWAWVSGVVDPIAGSNQKPLYVEGQRRDTDNRMHTYDLYLTGAFEAWGRSHDLVLGINGSSRKVVTHQPASGHYSYDWGQGPFLIDPQTINIGDVPWRPSILSGNPNTNRYGENGLYGKLRLRLLEDWTLSAGGRLSTYEYKGATNNTYVNRGAYKKSGIFTPYLGLTWDFSRSMSAYVSHAEVFNLNNYYDIHGDMLQPTTGNNREIGLKSEWFDGQLQGALSLYRLTRRHQPRIDPDAPYPCPASPVENAYCYVADNAQQVKGVDLELTGRLQRNWDLMVGASHMQKTYTHWRDSRGAVSSQQGQSWAQDIPNRTWKVWTTYRLPGSASRWRVGGGFRWQSETYAEREASGKVPAVRVTQPSFYLWDAMLAWDINRTWHAQLNVTNLFDKVYYARVTTTYGSYGDPRRIMFTLRGNF